MTKEEITQMLQIVNVDSRTIEMVQFAFDQGAQNQQPKCNPHPKAPHGLVRGASYTAARYVCECEVWDPYEAGREEGVQAMLDYDNPQFKLGKQLTTSEIIDCAVAVWRYDANDVSENTIKFGIEVQKRVLDRQK